MFSPDSSVKPHQTCSEIKTVQDFRRWLKPGPFHVKDNQERRCKLSVEFDPNAITEPLIGGAVRGLECWMVEGCQQCSSTFQKSNLSESLSALCWEDIAEGKRPAIEPEVLTDLITESIEAVHAGFRNGSCKGMVQSLMFIVREHGLCTNHRRNVSIKCPGSIFEQEGIDLTFYRSPSLERVEFLTGYPDVAVRFVPAEHLALVTCEVKNEGVTGITTGAIAKTNIGQHLAYLTGNALATIMTNSPTSVPTLGLYFESSHIILVRSIIDKKSNSDFLLRLQATPVGSNAINFFSKEGSRALMDLVHSIISCCDTELPSHKACLVTRKLSIKVLMEEDFEDGETSSDVSRRDRSSSDNSLHFAINRRRRKRVSDSSSSQSVKRFEQGIENMNTNSQTPVQSDNTQTPLPGFEESILYYMTPEEALTSSES